MELYFTYFLKSLIFPPGSLFLLILISLLLWRRNVKLARVALIASLVIGYVLSTPLFSGMLIGLLQTYPALSLEEIQKTPAQAIVVLSAGMNQDAPEYGGDTVGKHTLVRVRYGAYLHRHSGLPVLVSGGQVFRQDVDSLAKVMADSMQKDFGVNEVWLEDKSRTTGENALYSKQVLAAKGIDTVLLVTHAWHMPRSVAVFEKVGFKVIAAPTNFMTQGDEGFLLQIMPSAKGLLDSRMALHEMVGRLWYWLRY